MTAQARRNGALAFGSPPDVCPHDECEQTVRMIDDALVVCSAGHYSLFDPSSEQPAWEPCTAETASAMLSRLRSEVATSQQ